MADQHKDQPDSFSDTNTRCKRQFYRPVPTANQAYSIYDPSFEYVKGATVFPKVMDYHNLGDVEGIYFVLSRSETDRYHENDE